MTTGWPARVLRGAGGSLMAALAVLIYAVLIHRFLGDPARHVNRMALFWTWSRYLHSGLPVARIYNPQVLFAYEFFRVSPRVEYLPFAYPPTMLLLLWPLAVLPARWGLALWIGGGGAAFLAASWRRRAPVASAFLALAAPATLAALFYGQVSLLVAACLVGGWRLVPRHPALAGVLFALAAVKPQFGLLVPVALLAARQYRCIAAAALTLAVEVLASGAVFGFGPWARLPAAMGELAQFVAGFPDLARYDPTVTPLLRLAGLPAPWPQLVQVLMALLVGGIVWRVFRRGIHPLGIAALLAGTFLVTPYAVFYDLPLAGYAVSLLLTDRAAPAGPGTLAVAGLVLFLPVALQFNPLPVAWGVVGPAALFALLLRRLRTTPRSALPHPAGSTSPPAPAAAPAWS